jgi:hypothetical protein
MTGYLLLRKEVEGGSEPENETILYETKVFVPFAWSILFSERDARKVGEDVVLAAKRDDAVTLARKRMKALTPVGTKRLRQALLQFVSSIETAGDGWLVLDPYRIAMGEEDLTAPTRWFDAPDAESADTYFGDDDGVELDDDDDLLDIDEAQRFAGWPVTGDDPPWFDD